MQLPCPRLRCLNASSGRNQFLQTLSRSTAAHWGFVSCSRLTPKWCVSPRSQDPFSQVTRWIHVAFRVQNAQPPHAYFIMPRGYEHAGSSRSNRSVNSDRLSTQGLEITSSITSSKHHESRTADAACSVSTGLGCCPRCRCNCCTGSDCRNLLCDNSILGLQTPRLHSPPFMDFALGLMEPYWLSTRMWEIMLACALVALTLLGCLLPSTLETSSFTDAPSVKTAR